MSELECYEKLLLGHFESMIRGLRRLAPEHWDWTPHQAAPTPRTLAVHAWQWLMCDRQHIDEPDFSKHKNVLDPPQDTLELCQEMDREAENWRLLLRRLTPEDLDSPRYQFGDESEPLTVRWFVGHMVQNVIYKHGQFAEMFFALEYDGSAPYTAPFPNEIYDEVRGLSLTPNPNA